MQQDKKQLVISPQTKQKVQSAKMYIERRYTKLLQQQKQKKQNWDLLYKKMKGLNLTQQQQQKLKEKILHKEAQRLRITRKKVNIGNFQTVDIIGRGAFGEVRLCKDKQTGEPTAIKKMIKKEMIYKNKVFQARQQKDILANSQNNQWIVQLKYSFQDQQNLYLVMQYLSGGDLMNLLIKKDILTEAEARFYIAQILLAIDSVHKLHYIHRDLKPDNVLIDKDGHIKLSDFGLCKYTELRPKKLNQMILKKNQEMGIKKKIDAFMKGGIIGGNTNSKMNNNNIRKNRKLAYSAVGTPDYVAPEVQSKIGYTETVDWWSMGVILYEMLVGYPPFASQDSGFTWHKIQNWRKYLTIPQEAQLSAVAIDLIKKLVTDQKDRLGGNGVQEIKNHPFFNGVDWKNLRNSQAPLIPELKNPFDTQNFDKFDSQDQWVVTNYQNGNKMIKKPRKDAMFIGYTFKKSDMSEKSQLLKALLDLQIISKQKQVQINLSNVQIKNNLIITEQQRNKIFKKQKTQTIFHKKETNNGFGYSNSQQQLLLSATSTTTTHKNTFKNIPQKLQVPKYLSPKGQYMKTTKQPLQPTKQSPPAIISTHNNYINPIIKEEGCINNTNKKGLGININKSPGMTVLKNNISPTTGLKKKL